MQMEDALNASESIVNCDKFWKQIKAIYFDLCYKVLVYFPKSVCIIY